MPVAVAMVDREMRYLQASDRWCAYYKLELSELIGRSHYEVFDIPERWKEFHRRGLRGETLAKERDCFAVNGGVMWLQWEIRPWGGGDGEPEGLLMYCEDITARVAAEELVRAREAQLRAAIEAMTDAVYISDRDGHLQVSNEAFARFYRQTSREQCPRSLGEYEATVDVCAADGSRVPVAQWPVSRALRGETVVGQEYVLRDRNTGQQWVSSYNAAPIRDEAGAITGAVTVARDITQQRREREEREVLHRQYMDLVNNSPDAIGRLDPEGRYVFMNRRGLEMAGVPLADLIGKRPGAIVSGDVTYWQAMVKQVVATRQMVVTEVRSKTRLGNLRVRMAPEVKADGVVESVLLIATDLSALYAAEAQATEREALIQAVFDASSQAVLAIDGDGRIQLANAVVTQIFGYAMEELMGERFAMLLPGYRPDEQEAFSRLTPRAVELTGRHKDGLEFPVTCRMNQFESARGVLHVAVVTDITVQQRQEQQLRDAAEEIRALGVRLLTAEEEAARALARELHDDITQRLALLSMEMSNRTKDPASGALSPVLQGYQARLLEISAGVRRISHQMHPAILEHFGLSAAIESLCEEMSAGGAILVRYRAEGGVDVVDRNAALCLYRVCQECLRNIEKHAGGECAEVLLTGTEGGLELAVVDDGKGFAVGRQGRGLGVYSMQERVRLVGGTLRISSEEGEGTRVVARIPLRREALAGAGWEVDQELVEEREGGESEQPAAAVRILLADDHALLLEGTKALLPREYEVVGTAGDGQQAVAAALRLRPDVVVCDVSMPGMNGFEAVKRIRAALPLTKVVFLTMHNSPLFLRRAREAGGEAYVLKVAAGEELVVAIEAVLAGQSYVSQGLERQRKRRR